MNRKINILSIPIDNISMQETIFYIKNAINSNEKILREDINAAKLVWLKDNPKLKEIILKADIINADGQSIVFASKLLNKPLKERVTGIDLMQNLIELSNKEDWSLYFLGATDEVVQEVVKKVQREYKNIKIAGFHNGYFKEEEEEKIIDDINNSGANIVFVGISTPKKEYFINRNYKKLNSNLIMGVGGSFDVFANKIKRAPLFMQKYGLEWLYRLYQEPRKMWKRYLYTNSKFIWLVAKEKLKI